MDVVRNTWARPVNSSNAASVLCRKFKLLRQALKVWSKNISRLSVAIENTNKNLNELDDLENMRPLTNPECNFRKIIKHHLLRLLDYQKQYWKKCCTIRWVKFGDENIKFFQAVATKRYRKNNVAILQTEDGMMVEDHPAKEALLFHTYKTRLGTISPSDMKFDLAALIPQSTNLEHLTSPFTHDEIDRVVKDMPSDRAPGPNGFSGAFLKACWTIIHDILYALCSKFYEGTLDITSINDGLITLIPKINSPETVNDFRPITLLNYCLKLITKLLADRLQRVIIALVHRNQYGFIKARTIQDCLAWSYQYLHQCQSSGRPIILLKLDFAKAFDTIEHEAILALLMAKGFPPKWIGWVKEILSSGDSQVLLNGIPGNHFKCKRGVRQGDPFSPLLFVLAEDLLQSVVNKMLLDGILSLPIECNDKDFPIIQYADDTILLIPVDEARLVALRDMLHVFLQNPLV